MGVPSENHLANPSAQKWKVIYGIVQMNSERMRLQVITNSYIVRLVKDMRMEYYKTWENTDINLRLKF